MRPLSKHLLTLLLPVLLTGCLSGNPLAARFLGSNEQTRRDAFLAARMAEQRGDLLKAAAAYEEILKTQPQSPEIHHRLGVLCQKSGRDADAVRYLTQAHQLAPMDIEVLCDLGYVHYLQNRPKDAVESLQKAQQINPRHERTQANLAVALIAIDQVPSAVALLRQNMGEAPAATMVGFALAQKGELDQAKRYFSQALDADSTNQPAAEALVQIESLLNSRQQPATHPESQAAAPAVAASGTTSNLPFEVIYEGVATGRKPEPGALPAIQTASGESRPTEHQAEPVLQQSQSAFRSSGGQQRETVVKTANGFEVLSGSAAHQTVLDPPTTNGTQLPPVETTPPLKLAADTSAPLEEQTSPRPEKQTGVWRSAAGRVRHAAHVEQSEFEFGHAPDFSDRGQRGFLLTPTAQQDEIAGQPLPTIDDVPLGTVPTTTLKTVPPAAPVRVSGPPVAPVVVSGGTPHAGVRTILSPAPAAVEPDSPAYKLTVEEPASALSSGMSGGLSLAVLRAMYIQMSDDQKLVFWKDLRHTSGSISAAELSTYRDIARSTENLPRVEAALTLLAVLGDADLAEELLKTCSEHSDPVVRQAALTARSMLSIQQGRSDGQ